jgi:hypothetical protein
VLAALAAFAGQAAVVYKWVDSDGVIHFSDQPVPGAEKISTSASSLNVVTGGRPTGGDSQSPSPQKPGAKGLGYTVFSIASPTPEQTFFGDEAISASLALDPPLQPNHSVTWNLNGNQLDQGPTATQFALPHLERGTYAIAATITDRQSGESQSTGSVTFYVLQPSLLSPQHKTP